jgi:hypothetical protein
MLGNFADGAKATLLIGITDTSGPPSAVALNGTPCEFAGMIAPPESTAGAARMMQFHPAQASAKEGANVVTISPVSFSEVRKIVWAELRIEAAP